MLLALTLGSLLFVTSTAAETVDVERADGSTASVELATLSPASFGADGLFTVRFAHASSPVGPEGSAASDRAAEELSTCEVSLIGGDRIAGSVAGGRGEVLDLRLAGVVALPVSIEELDHFVFPARVPAGRGLAHAEIGDRLYVKRGSDLDRVDGTFEAFDQAGVSFDSDELGGSKQFPWSEVAALFVEALTDGGDETAAGATSPIAVDLVDGSRLRGSLTELTSAACTLELAGGQAIVLPLPLVRALTLDDGSIAFLSDRQPAAARAGSVFGDEFGMSWPHRMDRAVSGGLLRAGGRTYARGLGVHAGSLLTWELDGKWASLRGSVAIDDSVLRLPSGAEASVEFRIWLDREPGSGEPSWSSGAIGAGEVPQAIQGIDLTGVRRLTLEVDSADNLSVGDRADWLRMLLVRG